MIDSVISHHRVALAATGDTEEWTRRVRGIVLASAAGAGRSSVEHIQHLRNDRRESLHVAAWCGWRAAGVDGQIFYEGADAVRGWANQLPFAGTRKRIMRRFAAKNLKFFGSSGNALEQIIDRIWQGIDALRTAVAVVGANGVGDLFPPKNGFFFAFTLSLLAHIFGRAERKQGQQAHHQQQRDQRVSTLANI